MSKPSRLLRVVVIATLGMSGNALASIEEDAYDLPRIRAIIPSDPYSSTGGSGGTGYYGAASTFDDSAYNYDDDSFPVPEAPACEDLYASAPDDCDLANPPVLTTNGCGGGPTAGIVPDSLVLVDDGSIWIGYPGLFSNACNRHDKCYGTHPGDKTTCDDTLMSDMLDSARNQISPIVWQRYGASIMNQINGYGAFFRSSVGGDISMIFFNSAQKEDVCRAYSDSVSLYCRSFQ